MWNCPQARPLFGSVKLTRIRPQSIAVAAARAALAAPGGHAATLGIGWSRTRLRPSHFLIVSKAVATHGAHRKVAIPLVIEELLKGGMKIENITLICAIGLHRMNTLRRMARISGCRTR